MIEAVQQHREADGALVWFLASVADNRTFTCQLFASIDIKAICQPMDI
jgi:hypothetical protein